jgi:hypothetical protein
MHWILMLQVPDVKNLRDLYQRNEQAMLLVYLILSTVPEKCYSKISKLRENNVMEDCHVSTINECQSVDRHLATALKASFAVNHDEQPQWNSVISQKFVSCNRCTETQDGHLKHFLLTTGGRNSTTTLQKTYVHKFFLMAN